MSGINSNVVLLLHGDGNDGGTVFIDSAKGKSISRSVATTASAIRLFGQAAISIGTNAYLSIAAHSDFNNFENDFTIDFCWRAALSKAADAGGRLLGAYQAASNRWHVMCNSMGIYLYFMGPSFAAINIASSLMSTTTESFVHYAFTRSSMIVRAFRNGVQVDSQLVSYNLNYSGAILYIGRGTYDGGTWQYSKGWLEELRIVKGVAVWTEDFTPPTEAYSPDIPVAEIQVTQEQNTRIEKTYATATEAVIITEIPYDASEHPAEINLSAFAMAGTKNVYTVVSPAYMQFTGYAYASQPVIGNLDESLPVITDDYVPYIPTVSDSVFPLPGLVGHRILEQDLPTLSIEASASTSEVWNLNANLARIEAVILGNQEVRANLSRTLRPLTLSAESEYTNVVGSLNGTLNPIILATQARGSFGLNWTFNITLPKITLSATAIHDVHASLAQELEKIALEGEIDSLVFEIIAMNLLNKAITNFTNYPFNSFCYFNGNYYGCSRDGIYHLTGVDDFGTDIAAYVETGLLDLEVRLLSRIRHAYLGFKSSGVLTLTITTDDAESYTYQTKALTSNYQGQKVKFGKGFKDRYIKLKIANTDGCTFSIDKTRVFDEPIQHRKR